MLDPVEYGLHHSVCASVILVVKRLVENAKHVPVKIPAGSDIFEAAFHWSLPFKRMGVSNEMTDTRDVQFTVSVSPVIFPCWSIYAAMHV